MQQIQSQQVPKLIFQTQPSFQRVQSIPEQLQAIQQPLPQQQLQIEPQQLSELKTEQSELNGNPVTLESVQQIEEVIRQQQSKIEELQLALQKSQQQLLQQQIVLKQQQSSPPAVSNLYQINKVNQTNGGASKIQSIINGFMKNGGTDSNVQSNSESMKLLIAQQLQNKQLQSQLEQLQAVQQKVVEHQAAVMKALNSVTSQQAAPVMAPEHQQLQQEQFISQLQSNSLPDPDLKTDLTESSTSEVVR